MQDILDAYTFKITFQVLENRLHKNFSKIIHFLISEVT